jgi:hypothetical protein
VAHQVAVAMHGLRLQEQRGLLRDLAEGVFKSLPKAREKNKNIGKQKLVESVITRYLPFIGHAQ